MSPPLPIPSKAALRALRGLVFGTSCTLALITEDRRRRINQALTVLENGEKVKSARSYRAGGGLAEASVHSLEEEIVFDPSLGRWTFRHSKEQFRSPASPAGTATERRSRRNSRTISIGQLVLEPDNQNQSGSSSDEHVENAQFPSRQTPPPETSDPCARLLSGGTPSPDNDSVSRHVDNVSLSVPSHRPASQPSFRIQPLTKPSINASALPGHADVRAPWESTKYPAAFDKYRFPKNNEVFIMVREACLSKSPEQLDHALRCMLSISEAKTLPDNDRKSWIEASALLCRTCQELGRLDDAVEILDRVLARGVLDEEDYMAHGPLLLIDSLLTRKPKKCSNSEEGESFLLDTCVRLFLPQFKEKPKRFNQEAFNLGRKLLEIFLSVEVDRLKYVVDLYWRCLSVGEENNYALTTWIIEELQARGGAQIAVRIFVKVYHKLSPSAEAITKTGDIIVKCVEEGHNYKPREVLISLMRLCSGTTRLRNEWVIRLLLSHWNHHHDLIKTEELFNAAIAAGLSTMSTAAVYRIMVEIALEAHDQTKADFYVQEGSARNPRFATEPALLGKFARFRARAGDWQGAQRAFESMKVTGERESKACGDAFVPVLKEYTQHHTTYESHEFARFYIDELKVPITPYLVSLMAKQYASIRDVEALVRWLEYCTAAGFQFDAGFCNAILSFCRREKMPFGKLRKLFRTLKKFDPDCVNSCTERIMVNAAISAGMAGGRLHGRVLSLKVDLARLPRKRCASAKDIQLSMKKWMAGGRPDMALSIYKRASYLGLPFSQLGLRLAVRAQLKMKRHSRLRYSKAWHLVRSAQKNGHATDEVVSYLINDQLSTLCLPKGAEFHALQEELGLLARKNIAVTSFQYNHAALVCLRASQFQGAIWLAKKAAETMQGGECYNLTNFRILLESYVALLDVEGLRSSLETMLASDYMEEEVCKRTLKKARNRLKKDERDSASKAATWMVLQAGYDEVKKARALRRDRRSALESAALRITGQAVVDASLSLGDHRPRIRDDELPDDEVDERLIAAEFKEVEKELYFKQTFLAKSGVVEAWSG
ncbi:hypothetical protein B0H66DRAFT_557197 [Apodospora peruviana]|uniref:Pentatricopeptide repeat protein n=1 Tax=Apodospora peruviana TaxID=516989 RepID=A0AAE0I586_9PEZI|nr:hypothetical protein B0H66DRAFT_557197 [Apodospora peruviana]